jgi:predicted membrane protein
LGKLDEITGMWQCSTRLQLIKQDFQINSFSYPVYYDGIYAVIFNPDRKVAEKPAPPCFFFCQNKETIMYTFLGLFLAGIVLSYVFWRLNRYVEKYRDAKKIMMDYREQINELEQADTEVQGQSLKDKIEGITFTMNPVCSSSEINIMDNKFSLKVSELEDKVDRI